MSSTSVATQRVCTYPRLLRLGEQTPLPRAPRSTSIATSALILGTLHGQADAIRLLKRRGWTVYSCGHRNDGPGVEDADQFFLVDILDVDAVTALARRLGVDLVYTVGSDIAMPTVARVSEQLGLPAFHSSETTDLLHRKVRLRQFLQEQELSPVEFRRLTSSEHIEGFDAYPAIVKPSDSQGQRGITIVRNPAEARLAFDFAESSSPTGTAVIEEYLDGPEISAHVFVVDGEVVFFLPSDRHVWDGPITGVPECHGLPAAYLPATHRDTVQQLIESVVRALGVTTGPLYFQLKLTSQMGPRIIEIAPRLDGCHLWRLIEIHTGFNLLNACFSVLAGERWTHPGPWSDDPAHLLCFHLGPPDEPFHQTDYQSPPDELVIYEEFHVDEGELPRDTNGVVARLGYKIVEMR